MNNNFRVVSLPKHEAEKWLLQKHYAKRKAPISYLFGITDGDYILGVCSFGCPPNMNYNDGKCLFNDLSVKTLELNRLVVNSNQPKNTLSFFVSQCLKQLPKPCAVVSYADPNVNHFGDIYQATNWLYLGTSSPKHRYHFEDGSTFDIRRGIHTKGKIVKKEKLKSTLRYLYLVGTKSERKKMRLHLKHLPQKYPKGEVNHYECKDLRVPYQRTLFEY